jgi:uncharacterized membrane protein
MATLIVGLLLFLGVHLLREFRLRGRAIEKLGERQYRLAFTLLASIGLLLIVWGKSQAPFVMLYEPRYELRGISHYAMLPAFILVMAGNLPQSYLKAALRHPMLLGTAVWGGAHLWANGDLASVLLFGSFTIWALVKFFSLLVARPAVDRKPGLLWDTVTIITGCLAYALVLIYHGQLFGIGLTFA